jgi:hypothetical protein
MTLLANLQRHLAVGLDEQVKLTNRQRRATELRVIDQED